MIRMHQRRAYHLKSEVFWNMSNILEVNNLKKYFRISGGRDLKAVDNVSFSIERGKTLGIVGESGCGKTTCGRTCIGLYKPTDGTVLFEGKDVHKMRGAEKKAFTRKVQMIFQDPYACLDPRMKVAEIIAEGMRIHKLCATKQEEQKRVHELLALVGLNSEHGNRYIHEFSGGQRQRIGIARALALDPEFILCDEPIASLDVSIQAQIVNLLDELQQKKNLTYFFISHDLSMVKYISDDVGVMYLGRMMEYTSADTLYSNPVHPYTKALLSAISIPDPDVEAGRDEFEASGEIPSPINMPKGCRYHTRCPHATEKCRTEEPIWREVEKGHFVACHLV